MVRQFLEREVARETTQATRAEVWANVFEGADQGVTRRTLRQAGKLVFDREEFYEEVMRERRLL
jgi:hypothetical protein